MSDENVKPNQFKLYQFEDIFTYCQKTNTLLTDKLLLKYGFYLNEIVWLYDTYKERIDMFNETIIMQTNAIIKRLKEELNQAQDKISSVPVSGDGVTIASVFITPTTNTNVDIVKDNTSIEKKLNAKKSSVVRIDNDWLISDVRVNNKFQQYRNTIHVTHTHVKNLWKIINKCTNNSKHKTTYRQIVTELISEYKLPVTVESFNGGTNRGQYYFKLYYFPMQVLNNIKYVKYTNSPVVYNLKFNEALI